MKNLLKDLDIYLPGPPYVRFFFCPYGFGRFFHPYGQIRFPSHIRASSFCTFQRGHIWPIFGQYFNIRFWVFFNTFSIKKCFFLGTPFFRPEMDCFLVHTAQLLGLWGFTSANGSTFKPVFVTIFGHSQKKVDVRQYSDSKAKATKKKNIHSGIQDGVCHSTKYLSLYVNNYGTSCHILWVTVTESHYLRLGRREREADRRGWALHRGSSWTSGLMLGTGAERPARRG